jgi:hypothetical protein
MVKKIFNKGALTNSIQANNVNITGNVVQGSNNQVTIGSESKPEPAQPAPAAVPGKLVCKACGKQNELDMRFCMACGKPLDLPPAPGVGMQNGGDVVATGSSTVIKAGTVVMDPRANDEPGGECPICGKYNRRPDTFRCKRCQRPLICLKHQHPRSFLCEECATE